MRVLSDGSAKVRCKQSIPNVSANVEQLQVLDAAAVAEADAFFAASHRPHFPDRF